MNQAIGHVSERVKPHRVRGIIACPRRGLGLWNMTEQRAE